MSWFFETRTLKSEKNGVITVKRILGQWTVSVNGCEQTGSLTNRMWTHALKKSRKNLEGKKIQKVLLLGLGGGGEIKSLHRYFKGCVITVVEHDSEMVFLATELKLYRPFLIPKIVIGDAAEVVPRLTERFDLIVVDLFYGIDPPLFIGEKRFLLSLQEKLVDDGRILVNTCVHMEYLRSIEKLFIPCKVWKFKLNNFGLFKKHKLNLFVTGTAQTHIEAEGFLPHGFVPFQQWPEFNLLSSIPQFFRPMYTGTNPIGIRWKLWPLSFEQYTGDMEPIITPLASGTRAPLRIIRWHRLLRTDIPEGWQIFSKKPFRTLGFSELTGEEYWRRWTRTARWDRSQWLTHHLGTSYTIETISFSEFRNAYWHSTLDLLTREVMLEALCARMRTGSSHIVFWGARRAVDRKILAGIAVINSPTYRASYYYAGFFRREIGNDPAVTGLIDHWFKESRARAARFLHFGNFWQSGDPAAWKGFSQFKKKFQPRYIVQPPTAYKFLRG